MPDYAILFARSARKELEALEPPTIERVIARIEALASDPRPTGVISQANKPLHQTAAGLCATGGCTPDHRGTITRDRR